MRIFKLQWNPTCNALTIKYTNDMTIMLKDLMQHYIKNNNINPKVMATAEYIKKLWHSILGSDSVVYSQRSILD